MTLRGTRLWQDSLAHATIYEGDVGECAKWLGYAKQKLQFMLHSRAGASMEEFYPSAGVRIRVDTRPNRITVTTATGIFMESGFLEYRNIAPVNADTYRPSWIHYNQKMTSYMVQTAYPLQRVARIAKESPYFRGENVPERESEVTGCPVSERVAQIVRMDEIFTEPEPAFCDTEEIRRKKRIQTQIKPSNFTGKLKLFVQALYGSKREDYDSPDDFPLLNKPLFLYGEQLIQLHYAGTYYTSFIHTTADYRYLLCELSTSVINTMRVIEIAPDAKGEAFRTILRKGGLSTDDATRGEAYVLSTCSVPKGAVWREIRVEGETPFAGSPLAYGWTLNWRGDEGHIVKHSDSDTDQWIYAAKYRLDIDSSSYPEINATITVEQSGAKWTGVSRTAVFSPEYMTGYMSAKTNHDTDTLVGWDAGVTTNANFSDAPLYCFYDKNDVLQVVTLAQTHTPPTAYSNPYYNAVSGGNGIRELYYTTTDGYSITIKLNSDVMGSVDRPGYQTYGEFGLIKVGGGTTSFYDPEAGATITVYDMVKNYIDVKNYNMDVVSGMVAVPFHNCSAVFCGTKWRSQLQATSLYSLRYYLDPTGYTEEGGGRDPNRLFNQVEGEDLYTPYDIGIKDEVAFAYSSWATPRPTDIYSDSAFNIDDYDKYFDVAFVTAPIGFFQAISLNSIVSEGDRPILGLNLDFDDTYPYDTSVGWA